MTYLNSQQIGILVGLLLSDGYLERSSPTSGTRLGFQFTTSTPLLFDFFLNCFKDFITEQPRIVLKSYKDGPKKEQKAVRTVYSSVFTSYHNVFYIQQASGDGTTVTTRVFPSVSFLVANLTNTGLAVLLLCDGSRKSKTNHGYEIHTQGQNFESAVRLCKIFCLVSNVGRLLTNIKSAIFITGIFILAQAVLTVGLRL